jgi:lysozyme
MKASEDFYRLCKLSEGVHDGDLKEIGLQPKRCPAGWWTVGWGHKVEVPKDTSLEQLYLMFPHFKSMTIEEADLLLVNDASFRELALNKLLAKNGLNVSQNQYDALLDFVYNLSTFKLEGSTLFKRIIFGGNINEAFLMWNKININGVVIPAKGLTIRRQREADLYLKGKFE